ncbi:MAG TPA: histidinol dehydrogenase [Gemmatimonadaceae bacterium]|nr:histidinol dehydrogenase [Gemmatimonadaceae bacterium]
MLCDRSTSSDQTIQQTTAALIDQVQRYGDMALRQMAEEFDHVTLDRLEVGRQQWRKALEQTEPAIRRAMERAAANIAAVHRAFLPELLETEPEPGIRIARRPDPLDRVGVYAPGGRAAYPSSVLMGAVPARVAGVREVILCSPPGPDGLPSPSVLAAAELAGVDRVFAVGGAGAVAAMAYGTESIPKVDRIVGPGNAYVAEAKLQVSGAVAIDSPAGPSELLVVADGSADPEVIAREVMAQAEHDPQASVVVVAVGDGAAERISAATLAMIPSQERQTIIVEALATRGAILSAETVDEAIAFSNAFAPEHLLIATEDAPTLVSRFRNAGTIFVGVTSSVAFGDYMSGANHVLPTGGLARSYSGLSVLDFIRWTTYQHIDRAAAASLASDVGVFADAEGLPAHAAAARQWETGARP